MLSNVLLCDIGFFVFDIGIVVNLDDEILEVWFMWCGIDILGGGWRGFIDDNLFFCIFVGIIEVLFRELVFSLFFVEDIIGCVICFWKKKWVMVLGN